MRGRGVGRWWAEQWRRTVGRRSAEVRMLVLMLLVSTGAAALGALLPMTPVAPTRLNAGLACVGVALTTAVWTRPNALPWRLVGPTVVVGGVAGIVAASGTPGGTATATLGFVWVVLYTALFCSRATARAYVVLVALALATALAVNPFPGAAHTWTYVVLTAAAAGEALSSTVQRLHRLAVTDPLTGLLNREGLRRASELVLRSAERNGEPVTVAVLDLDGFKAVNDLQGHAAGDALLVELADAWSVQLRPSDLLARWGGDEFVLVLPGTDLVAAGATVERLALASPAGWSCGLAPHRPGDTLDAVLQVADADLYLAKSRRPGRVGRPAEHASA